ncbi:streptogrisin C. Serine peptidase. MEROPS family S01A [Micromonospora pattaloongensis]|uniref:Streptogrisin C. Serine peptidase. MEROPS family S01A n=1 Tax=Micromonospora pattaloongensis TaxID=405436 RepID=A0A1H3QSN2_9ACTN|nr:ricin-type beta-trefoil lectin domain protein [Micromonospora pattaloongensis]SDZ16416.1 streptogrisin C. Serine peptidase. MEROPS family S01A [Micromonospora pattaloongensis]
MRRSLRALAALTLAAFAAGPVSPASAAPPAPAPAPAPDLAPAMLSALQRDLHLTADQARARLAAEAAAPAVETKLRATLGDTFGGAWLDGDGGALIVGITDPARAAAVRAAGAEPRVVGRSERQLTAAKSALDRGAGSATRRVHAWYVDVATNSVVVTAERPADATAFIRASGAAAALVRTVAATEAPRPLYDVRGGDQYVINGNTLCSVGFSVVGGFVTAGHCGGVGSGTAGYNGVGQGTVRGSSFPGNDYGWVQVNSNWTPQPWVNNYSGGNVAVAGSQEAAVNSSVCRSGRTTGWRCGVIQAKNVTVNYAQGAVYGLTQSNACAEGGDSGGAWISGNQAQGVTSGGSGNCSTGGTMFFQPVNEILGAYGLSLVTTGGGSTSRIIGYADKCIDVPNSNAVDGAALQLWECNGTAAQAWTFPGDGTVRAFGMCMDVAWGSTAPGATIQLANCSGNPAQQFVLTAAGDLVNPQANKCVDVKDWSSANGARLITWDCTGGANQKWRRG